jgi:hypothetical protein
VHSGHEPVGILAASIYCDDLRDWLGDESRPRHGAAESKQESFSFVLLNHHGHYLVHSKEPVDEVWHDPRDKTKRPPYEGHVEAFIKDPPRKLVDYQDPLDQGSYKATFALVDDPASRHHHKDKAPLELTVSIRRDADTIDALLVVFFRELLLLGAALIGAAVIASLIFLRYYQDKRVVHG